MTEPSGIVAECLAYLEQVERKMASTPIKVPPPEGVANYLEQHFGAAVAGLLAEYLVEQGDGGPGWKTLAAILYLGRVDDPVAEEALQRFAAATHIEDYRELAGDTLVALADRRGGRPQV
ncbi:MAG: hypothetical protein ABUT39_08915 [Acidobacteriota bacterium]